MSRNYSYLESYVFPCPEYGWCGRSEGIDPHPSEDNGHQNVTAWYYATEDGKTLIGSKEDWEPNKYAVCIRFEACLGCGKPIHGSSAKKLNEYFGHKNEQSLADLLAEMDEDEEL